MTDPTDECKGCVQCRKSQGEPSAAEVQAALGAYWDDAGWTYWSPAEVRKMAAALRAAWAVSND